MDPGGAPLVLVFNDACPLLFDVDVSILADASKELFTPFIVGPLINEWSLVVAMVVTAVDGRYCLSIDGRFSLSFVVDGRALDETSFDGNVDWVFEASVTPLGFVSWPVGVSGVSI